MATTPVTLDFSKAQPLTLDFSKAQPIEKKESLPNSDNPPVAQVASWAKQKMEQNRQENLEAAAKGQKPPHSEVTNSLLGMLSDTTNLLHLASTPKGAAITGGVLAANTNPWTGIPVDAALIAHGGIGVAQNAPAALKGEPQAVQNALLSASEAVGGAAGLGAQGGTALTAMRSGLGGKLTPEEASLKPSASVTQAALDNSPKEVLDYAASKGIDLTPGEATGKMLPKTIEAVGERSLAGANKLIDAREANSMKLAENVRGFADRVDPKAMGTSEETAGEALQQSAQIAKDTSHENAMGAYQNLAWSDKIEFDPKSISQSWSNLRGSLPRGAEEKILSEVPRSMAASMEELLSPTGMKQPLTIEQGIQMRSLFRELGESDTLPDRTQGVFRQMMKATDNALDKATKDAGLNEEWRAANAGWKQYAQTYGDKQSPIFKILRTQDPATVTRQILNRGSAKDIEIMKNEGMTAGLDALKRQVITDVANRGFRISGDGLGGYSDSFIKSLFGPDGAKELYLNGEIARRMKFQMNPSGTGNVLLGFEQMRPTEPTRWMLPLGAAKMSMPRPAGSYLPQVGASAGIPAGGYAALAGLLNQGNQQ